jgi:hypothetical protein
MSQEPIDQAVDATLKSGRIGPALLQSYNSRHEEDIALADCTFQVRRGVEGFAEVVVQMPGRQPWSVLVGKLYLYLSGPGDITDEETAFFQSLDVGYN